MAAINLTAEQQEAISAEGKIIVSASAGSGKTFVMIRRLTNYILSGGDLDKVLAVTFTIKAAAQMKEKLRTAVIAQIRDAACPENKREHLKKQLAKIPTANISTIHSFCAYLIRTHFYLLDTDGSFDILADENVAMQYKRRAADELFDWLYKDGGEYGGYLKTLLSCYTKKRSDSFLRRKVIQAYDDIRIYGDYMQKLENTYKIYEDDSCFDEMCGGLNKIRANRCKAAIEYVKDFMKNFAAEVTDVCPGQPEYLEGYQGIADDIIANLNVAVNSPVLFPLPDFDIKAKKANKTKAKVGEKLDKKFENMKAKVRDNYYRQFKDLGESDREIFKQNKQLAVAFAKLVAKYDEVYTRIKQEEGKLDYNDLEHLTLKLLDFPEVQQEMQSCYDQVFVDEYQDVNPVQESIISKVSGKNLFLVGDVKQAIYAFRGSESRHFTKKIKDFSNPASGAKTLKLNSNFRSAPKIIEAVNTLFSALMRPELGDIDYVNENHGMVCGAAYPAASGEVTLHVYEKPEKADGFNNEVYSVKEAVEEAERNMPHSAEGLAVAKIILEEMAGGSLYDIETHTQRKVNYSDICILTRKNSSDNENNSAKGIIRELTRAGIPVSGNRGADVCKTPECKQIIDILSYIDNGEQDVPMASAMLSPIGCFTEDELAQIRIACTDRKMPFRAACGEYAAARTDGIALKLKNFYERTEEYRRVSALFGAATLIDKIINDGAMEAAYMQGNGVKLKNVRRLAADAMGAAGELSVGAFLDKVTADGYEAYLSQSAGDGSVQIMTMHSSKGLEFPIVIIADVCRQFRGGGSFDPHIPFNENYGFVHNTFDSAKRVHKDNILTIYNSEMERVADIKSEMNLLYVACTRAKNRLHILAGTNIGEDLPQFSLINALNAVKHSDLLDLSLINRKSVSLDLSGAAVQVKFVPSDTDAALDAKLQQRYNKPYAHEESVDLPVKSSASAILRLQEEAQPKVLFPEAVAEDENADGEYTSADVGTAYHRYLELCDFCIKEADGIRAQLNKFLSEESIDKAQYDLLDAQKLERILNMPVFGKVAGKKQYREQEFLCYLPADKFLDTTAADNVMIQGAIDLLCVGSGECAIIDYKYSHKGAEDIKRTYAAQLALYKSCVSRITGVPEDKISTTIVNICTLKEIPLDKT